MAGRELSPFSAAADGQSGYASAQTLTEGSLAVSPQAELAPGTVPNPAAALSADSIRVAVVEALAAAGHSSAAQLLENAAWRLENTSVHVAVPGLGKKMIALTVNAAAEKVMRQELQRLGAPTRFLVVPGAGMAPAAAPAAPLARPGGTEEAALAQPLVKRAQEIFRAEVRSVVDLRQN